MDDLDRSIIGQLSQDSFHFAADRQGGTLISGAGIQTSGSGTAPQSVVLQGHDAFVFADHFGQASLSGFTPGTDTIMISHEKLHSPTSLE